MKLIVVIMEDDLSHILSKELLENKISSTKLSSNQPVLSTRPCY